MFSLKLGLFLCILFVIGMEGAPEPKPEDLHIHLNLHDPPGAGGVAQAAGDYGRADSEEDYEEYYENYYSSSEVDGFS